MKTTAVIKSKKIYWYETAEGECIPVDSITPDIIRHEREGTVFEGEYTIEQRQVRYADGSYARTYEEIPKFEPIKERS